MDKSKNFEIRKLPVYDETHSGEKELISIHSNHKGSLIRLSVDQNINMIGIVDFTVGKPVRGNHYHTVKDEYFYLLSGKLNGYFKNHSDSEVEHHIIESGTLIHIKPGCIHAFSAIENGFGIEYCSNPSNEIEGDSIYEKIV